LFPKKLSEILIILDPVPGTVPLRVVKMVAKAVQETVVSVVLTLVSATVLTAVGFREVGRAWYSVLIMGGGRVA